MRDAQSNLAVTRVAFINAVGEAFPDMPHFLAHVLRRSLPLHIRLWTHLF
jgi:hypothetical protein